MKLEQYYLTKIAEEAAEVSQAALKIQLFGFDNRYPDTGENNTQFLQKELWDLLVAVKELNKLLPDRQLSLEVPEAYETKKIEKLNKYLKVSENEGLTTTTTRVFKLKTTE